MSSSESQTTAEYKLSYQAPSTGYMNQNQGSHQGNAQGPASSVGSGSGANGQQSIGSGAASMVQFHGTPQVHSSLPRASSTLPQFQQYPGGYYSDQYSQYQQMLNSGSQASQAQHPQPINHLGQYQNYISIPQQYPYSYYMQNGQSQNQSDMVHPYSRYSNIASGASGTASSTTGASASTIPSSSASVSGVPSKHSIFQQPIPQINSGQGQISQPYTASTGGSVGTTLSVPASNYSGSSALQDSSAGHSAVGQYQPPGIRPRVTTTMWEDEKTLCYQVDANNVSVVRRADNNMINGTKLLNVAQMTRGRRDGILKSEKVRHVVKIGSMHLKGVWIPFERALAIAEREGIVDLLYPLFVRDIKRVIQTGVSPAANAPGLVGNLKMEKGSSNESGVVTNELAPNGVQSSLSTSNSLSTSGTTNATGVSSGVGYSGYYPQYSQSQSHSNGVDQASSTNQSPNQNMSEYVQSQVQSQQPAQQSQLYNYQQPYYTTGQYYQPYNTSSLSSYGGQPFYASYGYINQSQQPLGATSQVVQAQNSGQFPQYGSHVSREHGSLAHSSLSEEAKLETGNVANGQAGVSTSEHDNEKAKDEE